ncbi:hypothetical protein BZM27_05285 [Paraburkholderia steynii]|uniref:Sulfotransferase domain-containing protein n=1 Tax=Paraburkholderia steynii TaxID=1245441 RepID=A0A4R0XMR8_9BURK|nr:hypothetical protein BZM27_05285 [Paraburkholderia steynii]
MCESDQAFPMVPECTFITQLIQRFHDTLHYSDPGRFRAFVQSEQNLVRIFKPSIDGFVETVLRNFSGSNAKQLVLKDPELTIYADCIPKFFDAPKIVCIIRDPREVVASFRVMFGKKNEPIAFDRLVALTFNYYYRIFQSELANAGAIHFVRYDKIVERDEREFEALEAYLGYSVGRRGFGNVWLGFEKDDAAYSKNYGKEIQKLAGGSSLSAEEAAAVQQVFSGYNTIYNWWEQMAG